MAAPIEKRSVEKNSEETDFYSTKFNPLKVLKSRNVKLPVPNTVPLNNLAQYDSYMRGHTVRQRREREIQKAKNAKGGAERDGQNPSSETNQPELKPEDILQRGLVKSKFSERYERHKQKTSASLSTCSTSSVPSTTKDISNPPGGNEEDRNKHRKEKNRRNVLTRMEKYQKGPLSVLRRCVMEKLQIQVWIRSAVELRGMCKGYLVAFDKHFNLAMMDVDELYTCPLSREKQMKKEHKKEKRRIKQLKLEMSQLSLKDSSKSSGSKTDGESDRVQGITSEVDQKTSTSHTNTSDTSQQKSQGNILPHLQVDSEKFESRQDISNPSSSELKTARCSYQEKPKSCGYQFLERHVNQLFIRGDNVVSVLVLE